ncbi:MAG: PIN domain-containing protein [Campylobacterales bacterium]|nr:PIN domain-containing protein [Campylobacterales bacterium]
MAAIIDTNIIIRFLVGDHAEHLAITTRLFESVARGDRQIIVLDTVLMETLFVMVKFYKLDKTEVVSDLKALLALDGVVNSDKMIQFEALDLYVNKNIDFVDALICAKCALQGHEKISFDADLKKC